MMSNNFSGTRGLKAGNAASIHWLTGTGRRGGKLPKDFVYINYLPEFPKGIGEHKVKQEALRETFTAFVFTRRELLQILSHVSFLTRSLQIPCWASTCYCLSTQARIALVVRMK